MPDPKTPDVALDLDTVEREGAPTPFRITVGGKQYTLTDPQEVEWETLLGMEFNPSGFLDVAVADEEREAFYAALNPLPAWKVRKLTNTYLAHFGMPSLPEAGGLPG